MTESETGTLGKEHSRRRFLAAGVIGGAAAAVLTACGSAASQAASAASHAAGAASQAASAASQAASAAAQPTQPAAASKPATLYLTIVTGGMIAKKDYPAYIPANFTLPANSLVDVTVTNFDDATPLQAGMEKYAKVSGVEGNTVTVEALPKGNPNGDSGVPKTVSELDPKDVSHTMTFADLGINVPIAPLARTTFRLKTGAAGVHDWQCFDPCGPDKAPWSDGMATPGYMKGKMTIV